KLHMDMNRVAQGDFSKIEEIKESKKIPYISELLNTIINNMANIIRKIKKYSKVLAENTSNLSHVIDDTTNSVENIAMSVDEIAKGSENTSKNITELSEAISNLNMLSQDTR